MRTRLVSLLMSGVLAGTALAAQRTAGLPLGTALLTAGGVLGQPTSAVQAARQVLADTPENAAGLGSLAAACAGALARAEEALRRDNG